LAEARLRELGLKAEDLRNAVEQGDNGRRRCQPWHPSTSEGQYMWAETVAGLRAKLVPLQDRWKIGRSNHYETTYREDLRIAIAVVGGDKFTGKDMEDDNAPRHPRVKRKRGPVTRRRVRRNYEQLTMFDLPNEKKPPDEMCDTWFLMSHADDKEIRIELSLAVGQYDTGYVSDWDERIIIDSLPISGGVTPIAQDGEPDGWDHNVSVGRK
jgi:hypothetical protein